jgi:effector-binding domain-containing protein
MTQNQTQDQAAISRKQVPEMLIASIRYRGKYEDCGPYFEKLFSQVVPHEAGPALCLYHDHGNAEGVDIECCVPVKQPVTAEGITCRTLPGTEVVTLIHHGSFDGLAGAWDILGAHVKQAELAVAPPVREVYTSYDPADPSKAVTELQIPVVP